MKTDLNIKFCADRILSITNFYHQMYIQEISHQDVKKLLGIKSNYYNNYCIIAFFHPFFPSFLRCRNL